jgi:hypothetical protein
MRLTGSITHWTPRTGERDKKVGGFGYIKGQKYGRFYLHASQITALAVGLSEPAVGCNVFFDVDDSLRRTPADLPSAVRVDVSYPLTGIEALAGKAAL